MSGQDCRMRGMELESGRSLLGLEQTWRLPIR